MLRPRHLLHIDGHNLPAANDVEHMSEVQRAAAGIRPCLDDQVGPDLVKDLLVDPQIERTL